MIFIRNLLLLAIVTLTNMSNLLWAQSNLSDVVAKSNPQDSVSLEPNWKALNDLSISYISEDKYLEALEISQKAILQAEKEFGKNHCNYVLSLKNCIVLSSLTNQNNLLTGYLNETVKLSEIEPIGCIEERKFYFQYLGQIFMANSDSTRMQKFNNLAQELYDMLESKDKEIANGTNHGSELFRKGNFIDSRNVFKQSLDSMKFYFCNNKQLVGTLQFLIGLTYSEVFQMDSANIYFKLAYEKLKDDKSNNSKVLNHIEQLLNENSWWNLDSQRKQYLDSNNFEKALEYAEKALIQAEIEFGEKHQNYSTALNNLAEIYSFIGNYYKAEEIFSKALSIDIDNNENGHFLANTMANLALTKQKLCKYDEAEELYLNSLKIRRGLYEYENDYLAGNIENVATFFDEIGDYAKAEELYSESYEIKKKLYNGCDNKSFANTLNNIAFFYHKIGQYEKSEKLFLESIEMSTRLFPDQMDPSLATSMSNIGVLYSELGEFDKSELYQTRSLEIKQKLYKSVHPDIVFGLNNLGMLYFDKKMYSDAEKYLKESLEMAENLYFGNHKDIAMCLNNLGLLNSETNNYEEALSYYQKALKIKTNLYKYPHTDLALSYMNLANLKNDYKDFEGAESNFIEALNMYKELYSQNSSSLSEKEREQYWLTMNFNFNIFHSFVTNRVKDNPKITEEAYDNLLFSKAMLLSSSKKMRERIYESKDTNVANKFKNWIAVKEQINNFSRFTNQELEQRNIVISEYEAKANELEKELSKTSNDFAQEFEVKTYTWKDVREKLMPNEAAVEIVRFNYSHKHWTDTVYYAAYIIRKDSKYPELVVLENGKSIEDRIYKDYSLMFNPDRRGRYPNGKNRLFYDSLWAPIGEKLGNVERVFLSMDGVYNKMNPSIFYNGDTQQFLAQELDIVYLTGTRDIVDTRAKTDRINNEFALFGRPKYNLDKSEQEIIAQANVVNKDLAVSRSVLDELRAGGFIDLPSTEIEVKMIDSIAKVNNKTSTLNLSLDATEEAVKSVKSPRVLHIATHGYFLSKEDLEQDYKTGLMQERAMGFDVFKSYSNPLLRSGLLLAGAENSISGNTPEGSENGILTAAEAMNLNLDNTELVVLSACETGFGDVSNGEGVFGLQRAFVQAGAKNLLMSLCKVPDKETQEFFKIFYTKWFSGLSAREAFKEAQAEMFSRYLEPIYWGSFVFLGVE